MGRWGSVVQFMDDVKLKGFPSWLPNAPSPSTSPWKRSRLGFNRAGMKATDQRFCSILKFSSSPASSYLTRCFYLQSILKGTPGACWSLRVELHGYGPCDCWDHMAMERTGKCTVRVQVRSQRGRELLCSSGVILVWDWNGPVPFSKEPITSQISVGFR